MKYLATILLALAALPVTAQDPAMLLPVQDRYGGPDVVAIAGVIALVLVAGFIAAAEERLRSHSEQTLREIDEASLYGAVVCVGDPARGSAPSVASKKISSSEASARSAGRRAENASQNRSSGHSSSGHTAAGFPPKGRFVLPAEGPSADQAPGAVVASTG